MDCILITLVDDQVAIVAVEGDVDVAVAPELRAEFGSLVSAGYHHLIVDLQRVTFIDSSGLGALVVALKRTREQHGSMQVVCAQERVIKLFRLTGLIDVFGIHANVADALAVPRTAVAGGGQELNRSHARRA